MNLHVSAVYKLSIAISTCVKNTVTAMPELQTDMPELQIDMQQLSDSSAVNRHLLLSFLIFEVYMMITVASTTDKMLIVQSTIQLPLVNVNIPLFGFFLIAPLFMIALHLNYLIHLQQHSQKVRAFIRQQKKTQPKCDFNLPPFMFNYLLQSDPKQFQYYLLLIIQYITVVLFPLVLLIYTQFKFSKYHSLPMTGWHYFILIMDLYMVQYYWTLIIKTKENENKEETWKDIIEMGERLLLLPFLLIILTSVILVCIILTEPPLLKCSSILNPEISIYAVLVLIYYLSMLLSLRSLHPRSLSFHSIWFLFWQSLLLVPLWKLLREMPSFLSSIIKSHRRNCIKKPIGNHNFFLSDLITITATINVFIILTLTAINHWEQSYFRRIFNKICPRIKVTDQLLVAEAPSDTIIQRFLAQDKRKESDWLDYHKGLNLEHRALQFANLFKNQLFNVNLKKAKLQGANLRYTQLLGAKLMNANLQGATLHNTNLQGANLSGAKLQGAKIYKIKFQDANLKNAKLQGVYLKDANLQGVNMESAELQGAYLRDANLQEAKLKYAKLQGANLEGAKLQGANMYEAQLQCTKLFKANLQGADLRYAEFQGADLSHAELQGADLSHAKLQGANLSHANLKGADLSNAFIRGAILSGADLEFANFTKVNCAPLTKEYWSQMEKIIAKEVTKKQMRFCRERSLKQAKKRDNTIFDPPAQLHKSGIFYSNTNNCFTNFPPTLYEKEVYDTIRITYLSELASKDKHIANGLSRLSYGKKDKRLARALLIINCKSSTMDHITKENLTNLENLLRSTKSKP